VDEVDGGKDYARMNSQMTAEEARAEFDYDPISGSVTRKVLRTYNARKGITRTRNGYIRVSFRRKQYSLHRVAWLIYYGDWPKNMIDHIDGNRSNNAIANMRDVPRNVNCENQKKAKSNNASGYLGVGRQRDGRFVARIRVEGQLLYLGRFNTAEEAYGQYLVAKRKLHRGNTL
jgi:hypothetical protein